MFWSRGVKVAVCFFVFSSGALVPAAVTPTSQSWVVNVKTCTASKATSEASTDPNLTSPLNKVFLLWYVVVNVCTHPWTELWDWMCVLLPIGYLPLSSSASGLAVEMRSGMWKRCFTNSKYNDGKNSKQSQSRETSFSIWHNHFFVCIRTALTLHDDRNFWRCQSSSKEVAVPLNLSESPKCSHTESCGSGGNKHPQIHRFPHPNVQPPAWSTEVGYLGVFW